MGVSGINSSSSLKDIQQNTANKKNSAEKTESSATSKYDKYVKGEDSGDAGIYSSNGKKTEDTENDGYRYRTRQEKRELKAKKSRAFTFGGAFGISAANVIARLNGNKQ